MRNKYRKHAVGLGMTHSTMLNGRDLLALIQEQERDRRRARFEHRTGAVHQRKNTKNRRAEAQSSNTKRGQAWKKEW